VTNDTTEQGTHSFAFGPFVLIPERQLLLKDDAPVRIGGRALDMLTALVENAGGLVTKRELLARAWPDTVVDEGNLKVNMAALRRALGDSSGAAVYIATVTGRGYRFIAPLRANGTAHTTGPPRMATAHSHNLPIATTRIFGRADAIDRIRHDLDESRLVSVVGTGGVGKTTVALAAAEQALGDFDDGVWLVDLAVLTDPALVPNALATAVGLPVRSADVLRILCDHLRERKVLLVLDSCEHVIDAVASCAGRILTTTAGVTILATSREPIRVNGERVRRLSGLGTPPHVLHLSVTDALTFPAIQLFVDRATDSFEQFTFGEADAPAVAEICRRLDGLALAIELAATRIDAFGVGGLLKQLDDWFHLLSGRRAGPARHRTLAATLDWSYGLLPPSEATLLRSVSVFAGTFGLEGAVAVSNIPRHEVANGLALLTAKSLLAVEVDSDGATYRLLETTRAYCLERLEASGEVEAVRQRHAEYVCTVLGRAAVEWADRPAHDWVADYGRFLDDLRGALAWAARDATDRSLHIRLTVAGLLLWNHFSLTEECRVHVSQAVEGLDNANLSGTAYEMHLKVWLGASTMFTHGLQSLAMDALRRALDIAMQIGDIGCRLRCLRTMGLFQHLIGEHVAGLQTFEAFGSLVAETDSPTVPEIGFHLSISEYFLGRLVSARGRLEHLHKHTQDASRQTVRYQSDINVDIGCALATVQWLTGSPDAAIRTARDTVEHALNANHHMSLSNALNAACPVYYWSGQFDECSRVIAMLDQEGARHHILTRRPIAKFYHAALTYTLISPVDAMEGLEHAIAEFRAINHLARMPYFLGVLADAQAKCGLIEQARTTIQTALDLAVANSEGWCHPEVHRLHASVLISVGEGKKAEGVLLDSIALARRTGALSWCLRAATDLARLWAAGSRTEDARGVLQPVHSEFTEGFETPDLMAASELLASLAYK
jgi:predicted ATPase/DNA-binding winged helix-turn-helix (wHTH) protein